MAIYVWSMDQQALGHHSRTTPLMVATNESLPDKTHNVDPLVFRTSAIWFKFWIICQKICDIWFKIWIRCHKIMTSDSKFESDVTKFMTVDSKFESDCIFQNTHIFIWLWFCVCYNLIYFVFLCLIAEFDLIIAVIATFTNIVVIVYVLVSLIVLKRFWHNVCWWAQWCDIIQSVNSYICLWLYVYVSLCHLWIIYL
jgi:hypothetical protein